MTGSLDEFAQEQEQVKFTEHEALTRQIRVLRAELKSKDEQIAQAKGQTAEAERALSLYDREYKDIPEWTLPPKDPKPGRASMLTGLADLHTGERVRPQEMGDYNKYDLAICEMRLERAAREVIVAAQSWTRFRWDGLYIAAPGDNISGGIHDELRQTDELSPYESVLWLLPRVCGAVDMWLKFFKRVHLVGSPGNHGRDDKKPRYKGRAAHNLDTMLMRLVAQQFKGRPGITFDIPESLDATFEVYGHRFSMEHGEEYQKKFSGSPEIGALGAIKRGTMRNLTQAHAEGKPFRYKLVGHYHQFIPAPEQGFVAFPTIKGFDEFARGSKFRPEPPAVGVLAITPERGIEDVRPLFVSDRAAEGW